MRPTALKTLALVVLAGCAAHPPHPAEVVTMKAGQSVAGSPPPGTVWRLDENDLRALSPAPVVEPPPPPRLPPPPRPNDPPPPPPVYVPYGPSWYYGGPGFHYWGRW